MTSATHRARAKAATAAVAAAVRGAIAQADLTQHDVADLTDIAINTLSRRLNGHSPFTWPEMVAVADATGVSVEEIARSAARIAARQSAELGGAA